MILGIFPVAVLLAAAASARQVRQTRDVSKTSGCPLPEGNYSIPYYTKLIVTGDLVDWGTSIYYPCENNSQGVKSVCQMSSWSTPEDCKSPQFEIKRRNQTARRRGPAVMQCEAIGEKPMAISWRVNSEPLDTQSDSGYAIREEIIPGGFRSRLSIASTDRADTAVYTCTATNAFGSDDASITMIIQEIPEPVSSIRAIHKSSTSIRISWKAPYDGNSPIKMYWIEYKRFEDSWEKVERVSVPEHTTEGEVFYLDPATSYMLRVVAQNDLGTSEPSYIITIFAEGSCQVPTSDSAIFFCFSSTGITIPRPRSLPAGFFIRAECRTGYFPVPGVPFGIMRCIGNSTRDKVTPECGPGRAVEGT